jgi:hypothetical protein
MEQVIFRVTKEELQKFLDIAKELIKIHEDFKILFLEKGILIYTILGEDSGKINVLKVFHFKWGQIFTEFPKDILLNITFMEGKKLYDKMIFLLDTKEEEIEITIHYSKDMYGYSFGGKNELLEVRATCQTNNKIKDLSFDIIKERLNSDYSEWKFSMTNEQLSKILKLSKLESKSELLTLMIDNGDVIFSDTQWDLKITKTDYVTNSVWKLKKEYLKYIINEVDKDDFTISIFPSYVVVNESKSYLLFSMDLED